MHAEGYRRAGLDKRQIAVVHSWTDVNPGHQPLCELGCTIPCPERDLVAASIEAVVRAHPAPGMPAACRERVGEAETGAVWLLERTRGAAPGL